ncbi:MAG: hypothetical protein ACE5IJ_01920 [Thermoplasmata archaeon]
MGMNSRTLLVVAVIVISPFLSVPVSAAVTVINVSVTLDRPTFYANNSEATAIAILDYVGAKKDLGDVNFTWFRPDWSVAAIHTDTAMEDANATSTITVDMVGWWWVNATYVNQTDQFHNLTFEVQSASDIVIVTDMNIELNAPYFEFGELVVITSTVVFAGNESLFAPVNFTWLDPSSSIMSNRRRFPTRRALHQTAGIPTCWAIPSSSM